VFNEEMCHLQKIGWYTIMEDPMVHNNKSSEFQRTKPQYNGAREAEDNELMSYLPIYSYDSPRAQVDANMA
jgi:hypothetical protein